MKIPHFLLSLGILILISGCDSRNGQSQLPGASGVQASNSGPLGQNEEREIKALFLSTCSQNQSVSTLIALFGRDRIEPVCSCAFAETRKTVSLEEMKRVFSGGAGILEPVMQKFEPTMLNSMTLCINQLTKSPK